MRLTNCLKSLIIIWMTSCFLCLPTFATAQSPNESGDTIQINKLRNLAANYQKNKQYQESIIIYQSLIKVQPENLTLHLDLALSYYYNQNFQLAKDQIDYVKAHPSFINAPELVVKNVEKLYKSINEKLADVDFKDPTFPSNKKTWDAFVSLSGAGNTNKTLITDTQTIDNAQSLALSAQVFLNYKIIKPLENWRLDQNINIYQLNEAFISSESQLAFNNLNYNIGYKKILNNNQIFSSEMSAFYINSKTTEEPNTNIINSQIVKEPSIGIKVGYQFKKHQFLLSSKKHWQNIQITQPTQEILTETQNYGTITSEIINNYWTFTTQYKSSKSWLIGNKIDAITLNWKTKPTLVTGNSGYFRFEQQIISTIDFNDKISWSTQIQLRHQDFSMYERTDFETYWYQTLNYEINQNWFTSLSQQFKYRHSTADDKTYNQWQYQLTLKWVN